jgi:hydroxymethylpyrimidine/phosphomethylpyrimidine kinase
MGSFRYIPVMPQTPPVVLTIAGFDPSSGAGITADIKTIAANGCYGVAAITAMTVQSTIGVKKILPVDPELLLNTLEELNADLKISAVHIGMLGTGGMAHVVAEFLKRAKPPNVVLDPVLTASSGASLLDAPGLAVLKQDILPLVTVITPNADEAAVLTRMRVCCVDDMKQAVGRLHEMGAKAVVITGGHLQMAVDLLSAENGKDMQIFRAEKLDTPCTHGTGCAFSTSLACHLAQGRSLTEGVLLAKAYVTGAIANGYRLGKGTSPVNHMYRLKNHPRKRAKAKNLASEKD